jgi:hypothetical protein
MQEFDYNQRPPFPPGKDVLEIDTAGKEVDLSAPAPQVTSAAKIKMVQVTCVIRKIRIPI